MTATKTKRTRQLPTAASKNTERNEREEAELFLALLAPGEKEFIFAAFPDKDKDRAPWQAYGTLAEHWERIDELNRLGYGCFVTVQPMRGRTRKVSHCTGVRAVWRELDQEVDKELPLEPGIVVSTSNGRRHEYLLVSPPVQGVPAEWRAVMDSMVQEYSSDKGVVDLARVLRLPGTYNHKHAGAPHYVKIVHNSGVSHTWASIVKALVRDKQSTSSAPIIDPPPPANIPTPIRGALRLRVTSALQSLDPDMPYPDWVRVLQALHSSDPDANGNVGFFLANRWSSRGKKYRGPQDVQKHWRTFDPSKGITLGTLFAMAKERGWEPPDVEESLHARQKDNEDIGTPPEEQLLYDKASSIAMRPIEWVWKDWIPRGTLTLLAGEGGMGKGTITASMVATLTTGGAWPDDPLSQRMPPCDVLWFGAEDPWDTVIAPRLYAAKADTNRVLRVVGVRAETEEGVVREHFNLKDDLNLLRSVLTKNKSIKLLVFDPITAYLHSRKRGRALDSNNVDQLRSLLTPLAAMAEEFDISILAITHFAKDTSRSMVHRIIGSGAWVAAARSVLVALPIPEELHLQEHEEQRALMVIKSNLGRPTAPLRYHIEGVRFKDPADKAFRTITATTIGWDGQDNALNERTLAGRNIATGNAAPASAIAEGWLRMRLAAGAVPVRTIEMEANAMGISERTLNRVRGHLGVRARREGEHWVLELGSPVR